MYKLLKKSENGFSLLELVVAVAVAGIIAAVAVPTFIGLQGDATTESASYETSISGNHSDVTNEAGYWNGNGGGSQSQSGPSVSYGSMYYSPTGIYNIEFAVVSENWSSETPVLVIEEVAGEGVYAWVDSEWAVGQAGMNFAPMTTMPNDFYGYSVPVGAYDLYSGMGLPGTTYLINYDANGPVNFSE